MYQKPGGKFLGGGGGCFPDVPSSGSEEAQNLEGDTSKNSRKSAPFLGGDAEKIPKS